MPYFTREIHEQSFGFKKRKETSQSTINLKLIKDAHQQEIVKLQNRHKDEIKRLKKDHEMELTYQIRNNVNKSENEAAHRYTEQLENDLKHSKEELAKFEGAFQPKRDAATARSIGS